MLRVLVDLHKTKTLYCGLGQFSLHLGRAMTAAESADVQPVLLVPSSRRRLFGPAASLAYARPWRKEKFIGRYRPWLRSLGLPDANCRLWHLTSQFPKYFPLDERTPVIQTIHDLNFLRTDSPEAIEQALGRLQQLIDRSSAVTAISQFVAGEIREHLRLGERPLKVIYNGQIAMPPASGPRPDFLPDGPFLFSIGELNRRSKNFHVLPPLLKSLPGYKLVIAGRREGEYAQTIIRAAVEAGVSDRVILPGIVKDDVRSWLYRHCEAFLFPSLNEGFGLPVLEAMSCGKPVFVARATSLPEVAEPLGFSWPSFEPAAMAAAFAGGMKKFAADPDFPRKLQEHAARFCWDKAAAEYLDLYRDVAAACDQPSVAARRQAA